MYINSLDEHVSLVNFVEGNIICIGKKYIFFLKNNQFSPKIAIFGYYIKQSSYCLYVKKDSFE